MYKIEFQNENGLWHDITDSTGKIMTFDSEQAAHAKLVELYPVEVGLAKYLPDRNRTRVIAIWGEEAEEDEDEDTEN